MKIGIIGPGAMGTFLAGVLGKHNEITLVGRQGLDIERVEIVGETELISEIDFTTDVSELSDTELIVICTKAFDTEVAVKGLIDYLPSECKLLSLQNGLKNEEIIAKYIGEERTIGGITSHGVTYLGTGKVKHAGKGETVIGGYPNRHDEKEIAKIFDKAGIKTELSDNIIGHIWKKVIVNVGINPITALLGVKNGFLLEDEYLHCLVEEVVDEATEVAKGYTELPVEDTFEETKRVAKTTQDNRSSMLQDIDNKRRTEIDQITGAVVEKGEESGVSVNVNRTLHGLVKGLERSYL